MSPRKMLSSSLLVFFLSTFGGAALADNKSDCNSWCGSRGNCDFCSTTLGCGAGAQQRNSFGGYGDNYYACESHAAASARNKAACDGWCNARKDPAGAIYCDRCTTTNQCGPLSYEHAQWTGYGDNYHACEDYGPASERNKNNCNAWCAATPTCHDCYDTILCGGIGTSSLKDWGGGIGAENIGDGWYACQESATTRQNREACEAWCSSAGGNEKCDYCSKSVGCGGINARHLPGRTWGLGDLFSKNWYACQTHSTASNVNKTNCENWCDANNNDIEADEFCDRCSSSICGPLSRERHLSWIGYGDSYHACEDYDKATARNRQGCEQWCDANNDNIEAKKFCDRCSDSVCGIKSREHELWGGYGEYYRACEDYDKATARNSQRCENWCDGNKDHYADVYCSQCRNRNCSFDSFEHEKFGVYGDEYSACEKYCIPLPGYTQGGTKERIDLVFVMDEDYNGDKTKFLDDVKSKVSLLSGVSPVTDYLDRFNFYYTNLEGEVSEDTCGQRSSLPNGLRIKCSSSDAYAVLHKEDFRDCANGGGSGIFSAEGYGYSSFIHEAGHALFGLRDEYDDAPECGTYYRYNSGAEDHNIWVGEHVCRTEAEKYGWNPDRCYKFTDCEGMWWKHGDPLKATDDERYNDPVFSFIMKSGYRLKNGFGLAAEHVISSVFSDLPSRTSETESKSSASLELNINSDGMQLLDVKHVTGDAPNYLLRGGEFTARILSTAGTLIKEYGFDDPRKILAQSGSSGPAMLDEAKFDLIIPLSGKIARAEIVEDSTGKTLVSADLSAYATGENGKPVADPGPQRTVEFSNSGVTLDGSKSYDPDGDQLTYEWSWQAGAASGVSPTALLVPGTENVTLTISDGELSDSYSVEITVEEAAPPAVSITSPGENTETQGAVRLTADASDRTGVANLSFFVREPDDAEGVPVNQENLGGFLFEGTRKNGKWEIAFDTNKLLDGHYVALAHSADELGNEGWSEAAKFGIRNWQLAARLPSSANNKAGRTIPLKFSVRMKQAVDPAQSFVRNEELEIRVYDTANPENILQTFHYGDSSDAYRIDDAAEEYIANFKTAKGVATEYAVEVWRANTDWMIGKFSFKTVK